MNSTLSAPFPPRSRAGLGVMTLLLMVLLAGMFYRVLLPGISVFSNDAPAAAEMAQCRQLPSAFFGAWNDLNSIGFREGGALPSATFGILYSLGPVGFSKLFAPLGLFVLGISAWCFFRECGLSRVACVLGGLAAALNSNFFSTSCWGMAGHAITAGMCFFALAALNDETSKNQWLRVALAGFAVGIGVTDGADIGALFSALVAAAVLFRACRAGGNRVKALALGAVRVASVAVIAAFFAAQFVLLMITTQVQGVAGMQQDTRSRSERWDWATQFSLPKREALEVFIAGIFGYRLDTPQGLPQGLQEHYLGGKYWGAAGRDPNWDRYFEAAEGGNLQPGNALMLNFQGAPNLNTTQLVRADGKITLNDGREIMAGGRTTARLEEDLLTLYGSKLPDKKVSAAVQPPTGFMRYSGGGPYAGVLVVVVAVWAATQVLRRKDSVFKPDERRLLWFWMGTAVLALLLAFGRHAPFYQLLYKLPYFSTIRNPAKFLYIFSVALVVIFAYGVDGFSRSSLAMGSTSRRPIFKAWWTGASRFDRGWVWGCCIAVGVTTVGWLVYAKLEGPLQQYLQKVQFDEATSLAIVGFSVKAVGWFVFFLASTAGILVLVLSGRFAGARAEYGAVLLGAFLVVDLGRANLPWIIFVDYEAKNATNPVIELLRQQPFEHRVAILPFRPPSPQSAILDELYRIQWLQHQFQCYNIQSLDVVQMPRAPEDLVAFETAFSLNQGNDTIHRVARRWQLTNTRYLLGAAGYLDALNQQLDPVGHRFRIMARFNIVLKLGLSGYKQMEDLTTIITPDGPFALFEFTGALPRAKVFTNWQVSTNDQATLAELSSKGFDPEGTVLVDTPIPSSSTAANTGNVSFLSYTPKDIKCETEAPVSSVLLLNDRFDPNWKVRVDGKLQPVLRCNYIMRGVQLPAGRHRVEFCFEPNLWALYVSFASIGIGLILAGSLIWRADLRAELNVKRARLFDESTLPSPKPNAMRLKTLRSKRSPA